MFKLTKRDLLDQLAIVLIVAVFFSIMTIQNSSAENKLNTTVVGDDEVVVYLD